MKNLSTQLITLLVFIALLCGSCDDKSEEAAPEGSPEIVTTPVSKITHNSAQSGGTITDTGLSDVTERGVVWSTSSDPKINENEGMTTNDFRDGDFTSILSELASETKYFVRAYATNDEGTAYGEEEAFTTSVQSFETVTIGDQVWMLKNLDVSVFQNGDSIPRAKTDAEWEKAGEEGTPAWCYFDNDPANGALYGKLYNWYAVIDARGFAPEGWHVPSKEEWDLLAETLGGWEVAGLKMKSTTGWIENGNGTNESGFTGLPASLRELDGYFPINGIGGKTRWWSTTPENDLNSYSGRLSYGKDRIEIWRQGKSNGFSVRCIKN
ncbi:fibrobacter succinogenes major paralogous domain-containing protein [Marivirga salinae]|uniref:Fibrobacter succinogenes major paralogous domain-containing protein n=1 Tax=Marivirga salinarum TaxID=3059078 RepID=A0AA49GED7_9BACT|nr:fibrobacter succinogenes major paralogous domain-containing protein [Marivirga sp. BDSF4-3]WKK77324.1 fibrobacter succinogenes major paralogous domain-containing protein [Marivirga sp. BDSF4-3]